MIGNSNVNTNFPHKFVLTDRQVSRLSKDFLNNKSDNTKLSKTQLPKIVQLGEVLGILSEPSLKAVLPLRKNVLKTLAKKCFETAAASAADRKKHKTFSYQG